MHNGRYYGDPCEIIESISFPDSVIVITLDDRDGYVSITDPIITDGHLTVDNPASDLVARGFKITA